MFVSACSQHDSKTSMFFFHQSKTNSNNICPSPSVGVRFSRSGSCIPRHIVTGSMPSLLTKKGKLCCLGLPPSVSLQLGCNKSPLGVGCVEETLDWMLVLRVAMWTQEFKGQSGKTKGLLQELIAISWSFASGRTLNKTSTSGNRLSQTSTSSLKLSNSN